MPRLRLTLAAAAVAATAATAAAPAAAPAKTIWLCRPGMAHDACRVGLGTTRYTPRGERIDVRHPRVERHRRIDCFYVYPTVSDEPGVLASRAKRPEILSIARYQAARYRQYCRVFAPVYRQLTLAGIRAPADQQAPAARIAYGDVRAAWRDYLRHYNHGRGVVLIGHSQGAFHLTRLVREEIDPSPRMRRRLVSAILLGGNVTVRKGRTTGGDFRHVPVCRRASETGCVIAFSTFDARPPENALFGRPSALNRLSGTPVRDVGDLQVVCTNPAALGGGTARLHPIFPSAPFAPGTLIATGISLLGYELPHPPTPWVAVPASFSGHCSNAGGAHVLRVLARGGAPTLAPSPDPTWGLHLVDANIALGDLLDVVRREAAAYERRRHPWTSLTG